MLIKKRKLANVNRQAPQTKQLPPQAAQLEIHKAKQEAKAISEEAQKALAASKKKLEEAEERAREIIDQAEFDADNIKKQVYKDAVQAISQENSLLRDQAKQLFNELFHIKREALLEAHKQIIKIALDLAEKIIRYQANIDPNILKTQVVEAIKKATSDAERVQVFVNPQDLQKLEEMIPEVERLFPAGVDMVALANESVDIGSCMIETKSGQLDARFSTQLTTLIGLCEHLETGEPQVSVNDTFEISDDIELKSFEELSEVQESNKLKNTMIEHEKELLEVGLLNEEESKNLLAIEEKTINPITEEYEPQSFLTEEEEMLKNELLSDEGSIRVEEIDLGHEEELQVPINEIEEIPAPLEVLKPTYEEDLVPEVNNEPEIENLEIDEVNEGVEDIYEYEEEEEEKEDDSFEVKNVLKPKKKTSSDISDLAQEVEKNPDWKELLDEE